MDALPAGTVFVPKGTEPYFVVRVPRDPENIRISTPSKRDFKSQSFALRSYMLRKSLRAFSEPVSGTGVRFSGLNSKPVTKMLSLKYRNHWIPEEEVCNARYLPRDVTWHLLNENGLSQRRRALEALGCASQNCGDEPV